MLLVKTFGSVTPAKDDTATKKNNEKKKDFINNYLKYRWMRCKVKGIRLKVCYSKVLIIFIVPNQISAPYALNPIPYTLF
jgi:hypothetical protein